MSEQPQAPTLSFPAPSGAAPVHHFTHDAMACTWGVVILGRDVAYARQVAQAVFDEIDRLEGELSRFVPASDISRINALRPGVPLRIGVDAFECLTLAAQMHTVTGGAFDVTAGALHRTESAAAPSGMHLLHIDRAARSVTIDAAGLIVDLGAIGKGYAVDRAAEIMRDWGIAAGLVHSGQSTVYALGAPPGETGWRVGLRDSSHVDPVATLERVRLRDLALSGSGVRLHGRHITDPRTGRPAVGPRAAWAAAPSAAISDALSTALMILSRDEAAACCRQIGGAIGWRTGSDPHDRRGVAELERFGGPLEGLETESETAQ